MIVQLDRTSGGFTEKNRVSGISWEGLKNQTANNQKLEEM